MSRRIYYGKPSTSQRIGWMRSASLAVRKAEVSLERILDPDNPRALSDDEILSLSTQECVEALEQIDQNLVGVLSDLDKNLSDAARSITDNLIPTVEQYGEDTRSIMDNLKVQHAFRSLW